MINRSKRNAATVPRHTVTENQQTKSKALAPFEAVLMRGGDRRQRVQGKLANREVGMRSWAGMGLVEVRWHGARWGGAGWREVGWGEVGSKQMGEECEAACKSICLEPLHRRRRPPDVSVTH